MIDRGYLQGIIKNSLPAANEQLLGCLSEKVEKEVETFAREVVRKLVQQGLDAKGASPFNIDIKA
jgi:hypothetical protein